MALNLSKLRVTQLETSKSAGNFFRCSKDRYKLGPSGFKGYFYGLGRIFPSHYFGKCGFSDDNQKSFQDKGQEKSYKYPE